MTGRVVIFGAGGFGRELIRTTTLAMKASGDERTLWLCDDDPSLAGTSIGGLRIVPSTELTPTDRVILAIGNGETRAAIASKLRDRGVTEYDLISPTCTTGVDVVIGPGAVLCDNTILTASCTVGRQFQCNIFGYVAHDCVIGDFVTFAPRVSCNGNVRIDDFAYVGTGAVIKQGTPDAPLRIGRGAVVGMGAVVTKSVPPGAVVIGNPAKPRG